MPNYENSKLFRIISDEIKQIDESDKRNPKSQANAFFVPFRMLSVSAFKYPFSNPVRIREAIKIQTVSYSGGNPIQIFPVPVNKTSKETSGFTFFLPDSELAELDKFTEIASSPIFPAALSLASAVDGNGITVWMDEKNICSVIWRGGVPELYRWHANKESALASEVSWLKKYCENKETVAPLPPKEEQKDEQKDEQEEEKVIEEKNEIFIFDAENDSENFLPIAKQSFASFPWLREINLSRSAINSVMILERFVRYASKAAVWLVIFGTLFTVGAWMNYTTISKALADARVNAEKLYRDVFDKDGRVVDPVSQARGRIDALKGPGMTGRPLSSVLADLGVPWHTKSIKITIDQMSYWPDNITISGSATDMQEVTSLRTALSNIGGTVALGDFSQMPGGGWRFNLRVNW